MTRTTPPTDSEVQASVERVASRMFPALRHPQPRPWRRRIVALIAGAGLFAGGLGVGVAAYAAIDPHVTPNDPPFGIDCYTNPDSTGPISQILMDDGALMSDPSASCRTEQDDRADANRDDIATSEYLVTGKAECIIESSPGMDDLYAWKATQDAKTHEMIPFWQHEPAPGDSVAYPGSSIRPAGFPANCLPVEIPIAPAATEALAACRIDSQHAAVYPLGSLTATQVCRKHGYAEWRG